MSQPPFDPCRLTMMKLDAAELLDATRRLAIALSHASFAMADLSAEVELMLDEDPYMIEPGA